SYDGAVSTPGTSVEAVLEPLDAVRRALLRACGAPARALLRDRELRVSLGGGALVLTALLGVALLPLWFLALGPIALGVPHVLADLRYLIARPGLHRRRELGLAMALPLLAVCLWPSPWVGLLSVLGALAWAQAGWDRRLPGLALATAAYAWAW